jgi:2-polyprenyl-6-methoxyphenol hydroxylase-like FAD-dependent oxidoreductase
MVDNFRQGRIFLAGDAAHTHTPAGGQGINSSVQDSVSHFFVDKNFPYLLV